MSVARPFAAALVAVLLPFAAAAQSGGPSNEQLLHIIQQQQRQIDELEAVRERPTSGTERVAEEAGMKSAMPHYLTIGGTIEVEATEAEAFDGSNTSDIALSTVELFADAQPTEWLLGHVLLLYEEGDTDPPNIDEAFAFIGNTDEFPLFTQIGKQYVPFGNFDTDMSADPLTLEIGETNEVAVTVGAEARGFSARLFVFNGDTEQSGSSEHIDQFGAALDYAGKIGDGELSVGASWINNIADSDGLTDGLGGAAGTLSDYVPGYEVHGSFRISGFTVRASYLTAGDSFRPGELAFNGQGAEPAAWHTEGAYTTRISEREVVFAVTAQGTDEAVALGLPERRLGAAVTVGILEHAAVTVEYLHDEDYDTADGGTGNDGHTGTVKLAVAF